MEGRSYEQTVTALKSHLRVDSSFDVIMRHFKIGSRDASLFFVDGFAKDEILERLLEYIMSLQDEDFCMIGTSGRFEDRFLTYIQVTTEGAIQKVATAVLSGLQALVIQGVDGVILIEARQYPARSVEEPDTDRVMRGSHDGFVETLLFNTALVRRRIRDPQLTMERHQIGDISATDVVVCYMDRRVNREQLELLRRKLRAIHIPSLTMAQESLAECLVPRQWYNPLPKVRYTERPDTVAACINEGQIVILVDNSASAMIVPSAIFEFLQDTNDFCFPPLVGTYLRFVRTMIFWATLLLMPLWFLLVKNPEVVPPALRFLLIRQPNEVPVFLQILISELIIDGIKLASLNTPNALNNAFSVVGGLILGEFAVSAGIFVPEVLLYMAFTATANFTQPSFELGYAFKLFRMMLVVLIALLNWWGFGLGLFLILFLMANTETVSGKRYLYPLIPFNGKALLRQLLRFPIHKDNC